MKRLKVKPAQISTQIVQRDRYAELICLLAIIASTLDKMATEVRELQRPEIGEVSEPFEQERQVGSSTMPHKRNPIICERVSGLAKIMRSLVAPALENVPTWHERDLTQSSAERFIIPEACILTDYVLVLMTNILKNLWVDKERMQRELIRRLAMKSVVEKQPFKETLLKDKTVRETLGEKEVDEALNPRNYLGTTTKQIELAVKRTKEERNARGLQTRK